MKWAKLLLLYVALCLSVSSPAAAVNQGDAQLIYGLGTTATPYTRNFAGGAWGSASTIPTAGGTINHIITRASPTRNELIAGAVNSSGLLTIYLYNGTAWTAQWTTSVGSTYNPTFDIAYEQVSGRAMVIYATCCGGNNLAYRMWNGTSWTSATAYTSTRAPDVVLRVALEPRPGTNEIAAAWVDNGPYLSANYWDGATSTWKSEPSAALTTKVAYTGTVKAGSRMFAMAFESVSGKLMLIWGDDNYSYPYYITRSAGPSGTWGSKTAGAIGSTPTNGFAEQGMDIQLASEPGTNYIAYANIADYRTESCTYVNCASTAIWNGSSWGHYYAYDDTTTQLVPALVRTSVKWVQSGGQSRAVVVYDDDNAAGIDWLYFNKNTLSWSSVQADFTGSPTPPSGDVEKAAAPAMWLYNNPFDASSLLYMTVTWNTQTGTTGIYTKGLSFNGSTFTWSNIESSQLASGLSYRGGWTASIAYYNYIPPVGSLAVDIVDGDGTSINAPTIILPSVSSGVTCQTVTAPLSTSSQKIRISNTTTGASWSATIAPTAGSSAHWTNGTHSYDMNDVSSGGCSDGSDTDTLIGRLSVNPTSGDITPQSGCSTTGVTKGISAGFSEGVTDTITLLSAASGANTNCYWDFTGVELQQTIPAFQPSGTYILPVTITVTAS